MGLGLDNNTGEENVEGAETSARKAPSSAVAETSVKQTVAANPAAATLAPKKDKPVSSIPVPGTPWCVVWTRDNRSFFYNPSNKQSFWDMPAELVGRSDVAKMLESLTAAEEFKKKQQAKVQYYLDHVLLGF